VRPQIVDYLKFDEYGNIRFSDEKARLDNFGIQLQNEPASVGYIVTSGSCEEEGMTRGNRARDYLVKTRGLNADRVTVIDGACGSALMVDLWILPQGVPPPTTDLSQRFRLARLVKESRSHASAHDAKVKSEAIRGAI
jgi:hypothetical protein